MKKTYNTKTNHGNVSLLAHIATQVWDLDPDIKCTCKSAAKMDKTFSTIFTCNFEAQILWSFV